MKGISTILSIICFSGILAAQQFPVYNIPSRFEAINAVKEHNNDLHAYTEILEDPSGEWSYEEVLKKPINFKRTLRERMPTGIKCIG